MPKKEQITYKTYHDAPSAYLTSVETPEAQKKIESFRDSFNEKIIVLKDQNLSGALVIDKIDYLEEAAKKLDKDCEKIKMDIDSLEKSFKLTLKEHRSSEAYTTYAKVKEKYLEKVNAFKDALEKYNNFADSNYITDKEGNKKKYKKAKCSQTPQEETGRFGEITYYNSEDIEPESYFKRNLKGLREQANTFYDYYVKPAKELYDKFYKPSLKSE